MTHLTEEELVLLYYGESGTGTQHLRECRVCREASESLAATLNLCTEWTAPEPPAEFARSVWAQLAPQLYQKKTNGSGRLSRALWSALVGLAVVVMVLVALTAGRATKPSTVAGLSQQARERILLISLADHLERAGMLLTEVANNNDLATERNRAQDLVGEGRLMSQLFTRYGDNPGFSLVDEVERCIVEIANSPDQITPQQINRLQQRVAAGSLIFKVKVLETNLRTEGQRS